MIPAPVRPPQARRIASGVLMLAAIGAAQGGAAAAEWSGTARLELVAERCSVYGTGFVDGGNGTCVRVVQRLGEAAGQHVRVDLDRAAGDGRAWGGGGTANAALRSDGYGMLPGAADAQHLRVPRGLYAR